MEDIVDRATDSRERAREAWVAHHERLWRSVAAWSGDLDLAGEAVAEAFAQALRRGDAIDDMARWVWRAAFRIAGGLLLDRDERQSGLRPPNPDRTADPVDAGTLPDDVVVLLDALAHLGREDRAVVVLSLVDDPTVVTTNPGPDRPTTAVPSSSVSDPTATTDVGVPTTQPATRSQRNASVELWTGSEYLVWSGEAGANDDSSRADGWRHDPVSGAVRPIALAPIAPRDSAAGVWTGSEMIVCCGRSAQQGDPIYDTASAAAYDPTTDTWRQLAAPPPGAGGYVVGAAWTGTEMLVAVQIGNPNLEGAGNDGVGLFAYDPASDSWGERAKPPLGDRFGETVWTGDQFVIWASRPRQSDAGASYDPATDRWRTLPELPEPGIDHGSIASAGDQLVVWGLAGKSGVFTEDAKAVGFRLGRGDATWRSMAPAPLPPIVPYEGTAGSQTLAADPDTGEIIVIPVTGYESGAGGASGGPPNLLGYDADADRWRIIAPLPTAAYHPELTVGGGLLFGTDEADPVVGDLDE